MTVAGTATLLAFTSVIVEALIVSAVMALLKVTEMAVAVGTLTAPLAGVVVATVGGVSSLPLTRVRGRFSFRIDGRPMDAGDTPSAESALATPGYFRALGIDLVAGRFFDDRDEANPAIPILVNETERRALLGSFGIAGKAAH